MPFEAPPTKAVRKTPPGTTTPGAPESAVDAMEEAFDEAMLSSPLKPLN
jgi:hypothetical protein